jgi:putative phosphoribosyl transferase
MNNQDAILQLRVPAGEGATLEAILGLPEKPVGIVLFAHGSGSSRLSPRNNFVAAELRRAGLATMLMDLLTPAEDRDYARRFDIGLLAARLADAARHLAAEATTAALPLGVFGASTGAAAALCLAAAEPERVGAVVSRGGRPDLAGESLARVRAPTLLIVGSLDTEVIALNRAAAEHLRCPKELAIVPGATHLFEEAGTLEQAAGLAAGWFRRHLAGAAEGGARP